MLNAQLVAELMRQRLGLPDDSSAARFINLIPQALKGFARKYAADPFTRSLVTTNPNDTLVAIADGKVDLRTAYTSYQVLKEYLDLGQIYFLPTIAAAPDQAADTFTIEDFLKTFQNFDKVWFATSGVMPSGLSPSTNYYIYGYTGNDDGTATFQVTAVRDDPETLVSITTNGTGTLTVSKKEASGDALQKLKSPQMAGLPRYLDAVFDYFYIQGDTVYLSIVNDGVNKANRQKYPAGNVAFAVPFYPATLDGLPDSEEAERAFLDKLFELAVAQDAAEDGEH